MELGDAEEALEALNSCISRTKWRLRPSAKRRLEIDILALCTGLRPVVMVDYGGKMPELGENLCSFLNLACKETTIFLPLRIMVIEDMIYIIHVKGLAEHTALSLSSQQHLAFVDLEKDHPKIMMYTEQNVVISELVEIQKQFASLFPFNEAGLDSPTSMTNITMTQPKPSTYTADVPAHIGEGSGSEISEPIDLSNIVIDSHITLPTLNGWLLGYPLVYLFSKENVADAVYNLSTKSLNIYKILICRKGTSSKKSSEEELMSFTVPVDLSMREDKEQWAEAFLARMVAKIKSCGQIWLQLRLEVDEMHNALLE